MTGARVFAGRIWSNAGRVRAVRCQRPAVRRSGSIFWLDQGQPPLGGIGDEVVVTHFSYAEIPIFADGFESGNASAWSSTVP